MRPVRSSRSVTICEWVAPRGSLRRSGGFPPGGAGRKRDARRPDRALRPERASALPHGRSSRALPLPDVGGGTASGDHAPSRVTRAPLRERATMDDLLTGMLVRHTSLGLGKVVAVEPNAVHVFFPESEKRFAAKLRLPGAKALLTTEAVAPDALARGPHLFRARCDQRPLRARRELAHARAGGRGVPGDLPAGLRRSRLRRQRQARARDAVARRERRLARGVRQR